MDDEDRVADRLHGRLRECTENLWGRRRTTRAVTEQDAGALVLSEVRLTDADIAECCATSLPVVRAWLHAEAGDDLAVDREGDTRVVRGLLG